MHRDPAQGSWWSLLREVSRSFYLSIRFLPRSIRPTIALGYLLARATDTIADTNGLGPETRVEALDWLLASLHSPRPELASALKACAEAQAAGPERILLSETQTLLAAIDSRPQKHRKHLREVLQKIISGQRFDLTRFHGEMADLPLSDLELDKYTYLVAGSVGEFWTELCLQEWHAYARTGRADLMESGVRFGKALQLINILRDFPSDLRNGRCYLPVRDFEAVRKDPGKAAPVFQETFRRAVSHLEAAWRYVEAIRPFRVRFACALPVLIGVRTLALLQESSRVRRDVKVKRSEVYRLMLWSLAVAGSSQIGRWVHHREFSRLDTARRDPINCDYKSSS